MFLNSSRDIYRNTKDLYLLHGFRIIEILDTVHQPFSHLFVINYCILECLRLRAHAKSKSANTLDKPRCLQRSVAGLPTRSQQALWSPWFSRARGSSAVAWRYSSSADDAYDLEGGPRDYRCACGAPQNVSPHGEILSY